MELNFSKSPDGLLPAIVQDAHQNGLNVGLYECCCPRKDQTTGQVTFYSRSKQRLWTKEKWKLLASRRYQGRLIKTPF